MRAIFQFVYYFKSYLKFNKRGRNLILSKGGVFVRSEEISFGDNVFINKNFHISARNLKIGNDVMIGPNLVIECDNHVYNVIGESMFHNKKRRNIASIQIKDDVWIGANVTILSGVVIETGSIIGAGSVVTKSTLPYSINVGNPCKFLKNRFSNEELVEHLNKIKDKCNN